MTLSLVDSADALSTFSTAQDGAVARDVGTLLGSTNGNLGHVAYQSLPDLIQMHADNAGLFTANWYDELDPTSSFRAKPMFDIPPEQITKAIDWALYAPGDEPPIARMTGSSQRLVRQASRQTVVGNAAKEGVQWARYAKPTACAFCRLLATRGAVYHSEKTAGGDGHSYHDHCDCTPVALRAGQLWTPPEYAAGWEQQYADAAKVTKRGKGYFKRVVAAMRDAEKPAPEEKPVEPVEKAVEPVATPALSAEEAAQAAAKQAALKDLDAAKDWRAVQKVAKRILPDTNINFGGVIGGLSPETGSVPDTQISRDVVRAVDDVLTQFPEMRLETLTFDKSLKPNVYAHAKSYTRLQQRVVSMNRRFTDLPGLYQNSWNTTVQDGFHHPSAESPAYSTIVHEMGHVMEDIAAENGVDIDASMLDTALADYFKATRPLKPGAATAWGQNRIAEYSKWLLSGLSGYSRADPKSADSVALNVPEALAEAFADVFINGDSAQEPSKVIHKVLTDALGGQSYWDMRLGGGGPAAAAA